LGIIAAAGTVATAAAFALAASASGGRWVEAANEVVFALVGLGVVAPGSPDARSVAGGDAGAAATAIGLGVFAEVLEPQHEPSVPSGPLGRPSS
jgi:hypothetical protein